MILEKTHELVQEYKDRMSALDPKQPDYKEVVRNTREEFNLKLKKILGEIDYMHFLPEDI